MAVHENPYKSTKNVRKYASPMDVGWVLGFAAENNDFMRPIGSMYGIFTYIYHKNLPNVGIYTIHGSYGRCVFFCVGSGLEGHQLQNHRGTTCGFGWTVRWWQEYSDVSPSAFLRPTGGSGVVKWS